jgi:hypothetical protein
MSYLFCRFHLRSPGVHCGAEDMARVVVVAQTRDDGGDDSVDRTEKGKACLHDEEMTSD